MMSSASTLSSTVQQLAVSFGVAAASLAGINGAEISVTGNSVHDGSANGLSLLNADVGDVTISANTISANHLAGLLIDEWVEVVNAGVPGYTSIEQRVNFMLRISHLEPDAVLIYGDTVRSPELRHEVPLGVPDAFLYAEKGGVKHIVISTAQ
jgi:hypothetical protein